MKKNIFVKAASVMCVLVFLFLLTASAATYDLSTGLDVLKNKVEVKKCGVMNTTISFSEADFDRILGKPEYIKILTLPERTYGTLKLAGTAVKEGQTFTRASLTQLTFEPTLNMTSTASFTLCNAGDKSGSYGVCTMYVLESINLAPKASENSFETQKNISCKGFLKAYDPEEDEISYVVSSSVRNGTLQIQDASAGCFIYTPKKDFIGRDTFSYYVVDKYGNKSKTVRGVIHVVEREAETTFYDMTNHWAHNSAIKLVASGLFDGEIIDGKLCFCPDKEVSRGDFLAMAMITAGLEEKVERVSVTSFSDDSEIPYNIKGYAETALNMGIINGYPDGVGGVRFKSSESITRSEASVILARILGTPAPSYARTFSDSDSVPGWAQESFSSLCHSGILSGTGYGEILPESILTRAQTAEILSNVSDYIEQSKKEEKRTIFNLFGLL